MCMLDPHNTIMVATFGLRLRRVSGFAHAGSTFSTSSFLFLVLVPRSSSQRPTPCPKRPTGKMQCSVCVWVCVCVRACVCLHLQGGGSILVAGYCALTILISRSDAEEGCSGN